VDRALLILTSPAAAMALAAGLMFTPAAGPLTWPSLGRGRPGSAVTASFALALLVFLLARLMGVPAGG
jgi:hypothetical protein